MGLIMAFLLNIVAFHALSQHQDNWLKYLDKVDGSYVKINFKEDEIPVDYRNKILKKEIVFHKQLNKAIVLKTLYDDYDGKIDRISPVNYRWKVSNRLQTEKTPKRIVLATTDSLSIDYLKAEAERSFKGKFFVVNNPSNEFLIELLKDPNVVYISSESTSPSVEARVIDMNLYANTISKLHSSYVNRGADMLISIKENYFDSNDIDFRNRIFVTGKEAERVDNHASEMATIIAGAGNSFINGKGVAPAATITSESFEDIFPEENDYFSTNNIVVQNHSYGTEIENFYGALASAFDESSLENPELLHIFSSGNRGEFSADEGKYSNIQGYANLTGNFKQAKNVLVIGSIDTVGNAIPFVSVGPAFDGRIKPDLVAYSRVGSSNSAALVSGVASLLQEKYNAVYDSYAPSSLIRGLLINSAKDVFEPGPDYKSGFGNLDAFQSMVNLDSGNFFLGTLMNDGDSIVRTVSIPENTDKVKVTLVWTDLPAMPSSEPALINDLDLYVADGLGGKYLPWVLDDNPDNLSAIATRGIDRLNTVETVWIEKPTAGEYQIIIKSSSLASSQEFSVAYSVDAADVFYWEYPNERDNFPYDGENASYFQWSSTYGNINGELSISYDEGQSWDIISPSIPVQNGLFRWEPPLLNSKAIARMKLGEQFFYTDTFSVSYPINIDVGFDCGDSLLMSWNKETGVAGFELYTLGDTYTDLIDFESDTFTVIDPDLLEEGRFKVQPLSSDGFPFMPSPMISYTNFSAGCFYNNLFSLSRPEAGIELTLNLTTTAFVESVTFYRHEDEKVPIASFIAPDLTRIVLIDDKAKMGYNSYSADIFLSNGVVIPSDTTGSYFVKETEFLVFPNPISNSERLRIFSGSSEKLEFSLYTMNGSLVYFTNQISDVESIPLYDLRKGVYLYEIRSKQGRKSGRLIIN